MAVDDTPWQVENLRLTSFLTPQTPWDPTIDWWTPVVERDSAARTVRRSPPLILEQGRIDSSSVRLQVAPRRVDFVVAQDGPSDEPSTTSFHAPLALFRRIGERWLGIAPPLARLAVGAEFLSAIDDRKEGFRRLLRLLPNVQMDVETSTDLVYQINRPRPTTTPINGLVINRLSNWSVALVQRVLIAASTGIAEETISPPINACRIVLDINTAQEFTRTLPRNELIPLFDELLGLALEIADRGDIA